MPDIAKINAVAIADIEKVDGILAANIEKVNGLVFSTAPAFVGLLDTYTGAAAGYSTRRLASSATNLMRIREDSGDTETDIGYDSNGDLDTAAIATHCGTANGFVVTWYDQAGSNNATQSTSSSQPQIYNGTAVITENGKPAVQFDGSDSHFTTSYTLAVTTTSYSGFIVSKTTNAAAQQILIQGGRTHLSYSSSNQLASFIGGAGTTSPSAVGTNQILAEYIYDQSGTTVSIYANGSLLASQTRTGSSNNFLRIAKANDGRFNLDGVMQELVIWPTDQDADTNRTGIESNINNHFAIGNLPNPTSGLLFDYPDAAAAYSVRQLANTAPLSMRVRRDTAGGTGDDDEADVLFDFTLTDPTISLDSRINNPSAGVASTTLGEFLNATGYTDVDNLTVVADGFCNNWYDQSGNGIDAEQTVPGSQPQIFDSASPTDLITVNGKPTIYQGGLQSATITPLAQPNTAFVVNKLDSLKGAVLLDGKTSGNRNLINHGGGPVQIGMYAGSTTVRNTPSDLNQRLYSVLFNGANSEIWRDGTSITTGNPGTASSDGFSINSIFNGTIDDGDNIQEFIFWNSDQDTAGNRSGIETNINTYFSIYT